MVSERSSKRVVERSSEWVSERVLLNGAMGSRTSWCSERWFRQSFTVQAELHILIEIAEEKLGFSHKYCDFIL